ncbi:hypothetical protein KKD37_01265 [Patescibacteria group bacterium]|nr:hypothetical protein [Patescibacteria group bacterium]
MSKEQSFFYKETPAGRNNLRDEFGQAYTPDPITPVQSRQSLIIKEK